MVDESIDVAVQKKLLLYCRIIENGEAKGVFGTNVEVPNGKAETVTEAIMTFLDERGICIEKVVGLGTDGANIMVGSKNGVGVRLQIPELLPCGALPTGLRLSRTGPPRFANAW